MSRMSGGAWYNPTPTHLPYKPSPPAPPPPCHRSHGAYGRESDGIFTPSIPFRPPSARRLSL